nr:muconolactone Delta-isomerase family protein [Agrobacterium vitis]
MTISRRRTEQFGENDFAAKRDEEAERIRALYVEGAIRQIWFRGDHPGACILWEAASDGEVRAHLSTLPYNVAGMLEIVSVIPLLPYLGFGPGA